MEEVVETRYTVTIPLRELIAMMASGEMEGRYPVPAILAFPPSGEGVDIDMDKDGAVSLFYRVTR